ncbi:MAG: aldo/keto reductase [Candidatus Methanofastidiosia archaeon]|jgi:predicted aldo/keto reductase-like oxidoreductase
MERDVEGNMTYRTLGRTGLETSTIGLGTEYLYKQSRETVNTVIHTAIDNGVNYIDLVFSFPQFLENIGSALKGYRDKVFLAVHLGSAEINGQYKKTRDIKECRNAFLDSLSYLGTDYADIVNIHFVKTKKEYDAILSAGIIDLAHQLKEDNKACYVGMSTHDLKAAITAAESGVMDMIMIQVNIANNAMPHRDEMLSMCAKNKVGVVAMKPFAGGKLFQKNRTVRIAQYQTGGAALKKKIPSDITPVQCISYVLSQVGVCTTVPGVKNVEELHSVLQYMDATPEEKDYSSILTSFKEYITGECVYCNHCLPCPASIDIGGIIRLLDTSGTESVQQKYDVLSAKASDCTECGACVERCPFEVDVLTKMKRAVAVFEQ